MTVSPTELTLGTHQKPAAAQTPELCVVLPCFNERENVPVLVARLATVLAGIAWEAVFVDDNSPDGTADVIRALAQADLRIRCLKRIGRRGLSSACIEGILSTSAPYIAVMDADLQHDEALLPQMLQRLRQGPEDLVIASRYTGSGRSDAGPSEKEELGFGTGRRGYVIFELQAFDIALRRRVGGAAGRKL